MPSRKLKTPHISDLSLEKITRIVLIVGIISVSGAIVYTLTSPKEDDILFFLLNEEQMLKDYPTNVTQGNKVIIHIFIQNLMHETKNFQIHIYRGYSDTYIDPEVSIISNPNVTSVKVQNIVLANEEQWISDPIEVEFTEIGDNQLIICELWIKNGEQWEYLPGYVLTLRIDVIPS